MISSWGTISNAKVMTKYPIADEIETIVLDEADKLLDPLPKHASMRLVQKRLRHPRPTTHIMDLIVYRRQFGPNDDRRHFRAQSSQCQIICASASLTSSVKRELVQRGWCHPKKIAMVKLSDGFTVPKSVRHLVVDEQACVQHGIPFESTLQQFRCPND